MEGGGVVMQEGAGLTPEGQFMTLNNSNLNQSYIGTFINLIIISYMGVIF